MKSFSTVEELETFLLKHGESIVDLMGGEIDRIELKLRVSINSSTLIGIQIIFFCWFSISEKIPGSTAL